MYVPRAVYSFRMSFCTVPLSLPGSTPCSSATSSYSSSRMAAVALMVIDVVTLSSGMLVEQPSMSSSESIATPTLPTSPSARGMVGVVAHLRRQVEGDGQPGLAAVEQIAEPRVGLRRPCRSPRTAAWSTAGRGTSSGRCRA